MSRPTIQHVVFISSVLALASCGEAKYNLSDNPAQKGREEHCDSQMSIQQADITVTGASGSVSGKADSSIHSSSITRILEVDGERASVKETFHARDTTEGQRTLNGKTETIQGHNALDGAVVLAKRTNGIWKKTLKYGQPTPELKRELSDEPAISDSWCPNHSITVGETWSVPSAQLKPMLGTSFLVEDGSMDCKFVNVGTLGDEKCAVITVSLSIRGIGLDKDNNEAKVTMSLQGTIYRSLGDRVDLKTELRGFWKHEGDVTEDGKKLSVTIKGPIALTTTCSLKWTGRENGDVASIERVLQADNGSAAEIKSGADVAGVVRKMRAIALDGCPWDFASAYISHIHAWEDRAAVARDRTAFEEKVSPDKGISGFFNLVSALFSSEHTKLDAANKSASSEIEETFKHVQNVAVAHGAKLPLPSP